MPPRKTVSKPAPEESEDDTFPAEEEIDESASGLPPLPDPTQIVPPSDLYVPKDGSREFSQQAAQHHYAMQTAGADKSVRNLEEAISVFAEKYPGGYLRVERIGPLDVPRTEMGDIGKIRVKELDGSRDLNEMLLALGGGGEYRLTTYTTRGRPVTMDPMVVEISGDFKPRSRDGRDHLSRKSSPEWNAPAAQEGNVVEAVLAQNANLLERLSHRGGDETSTVTSFLNAFIAQQQTQTAALIATLKESQAVAMSAFERRAAEEKAERDERKQQAQRDHEIKLKQLDLEQARDVAAAKSGKKYDYLFAKTQMTLGLRQREMELAGPLGVKGQKVLQSKILGKVIDQAMESYGLNKADDVEREGFGAQFMANVVQPLIEKHGDKAIDIISRLFAGKGAGAPPMPGAAAGTRFLPAPSPPAPAGAPQPENAPAESAIDSVDVAQQVTAQPAQDEVVASPGDATTNGQAAAGTMDDLVASGVSTMLARANLFLSAVAREMIADSDPSTAWDADVDEERPIQGRTIEWLFDRMALQYRESLAKGWGVFKLSLPPDRCGPALVALDKAMGNPAAKAWFDEFLAAGPWNDDSDDVLDFSGTPDAVGG